MHLRLGAPRLWIVPITIALLAAACSGSASTTLVDPVVESETAAPAEPTAVAEPTVEPTTAPQVEPTLVPEPTAAPEPTAVPEPVYFSSDLEPGDCFNRLPNNPPLQPPNKVSCDELHEEEVYAKALLDDPADAPYPGEDPLADRAAVELCNAATVDFAGEGWDLLAMGTLLLYPLEEDWAAGDRTIMCSATSSDQGTLKIGSAAGGTIDTDDVLIVRTSLANDGVAFDDWAIFTEHTTVGTLGSLTDGQFDLPLRRPFQGPQGFVFDTTNADDDGHATTGWGYRWDTQELTDLGSLLPGQELSSTVVIDDGGVIFAARETPDDDFDLWGSASGTAELLVGGDGNQQYPTLTPDQTQVVYQDNGDIWVVNIDGSDPLQLTSGPANDYESIVSPDGTTVVFASDRSGNDDLWAIPITGGEPVNLTDHPADESWPVFSEDGTYLYFGSDRLLPEDDRSHVMVMNADGSNQSWFAATTGSHAIVVPEQARGVVLSNALTLNERYNYELIQGLDGSTQEWSHSSGRLTVELPVGWRVGELDDFTGFIAGLRPDQYYERWEIDGVEVTLWDETEDVFLTIFEDTQAVRTCEQFDGSDGLVPIDGDIVGISANFNCGADGAVGGVIGLYNRATNVGVLIEGQRDNFPDADLDNEMLTAIARSLAWE